MNHLPSLQPTVEQLNKDLTLLTTYLSLRVGEIIPRRAPIQAMPTNTF